MEGIYRAQIPPAPGPPRPQKKNPQKIHLLEVPYQVIFPPFFGPRGPGGVLRSLFRCRISLGCEFHHVIYLISSPLYKNYISITSNTIHQTNHSFSVLLFLDHCYTRFLIYTANRGYASVVTFPRSCGTRHLSALHP